jgi:orotate phosphoribosyltransferase-like protein
MPKMVVTQDILDRLESLSRSGRTQLEIARELHISTNTVSKLQRRLGLREKKQHQVDVVCPVCCKSIPPRWVSVTDQNMWCTSFGEHQ